MEKDVVKICKRGHVMTPDNIYIKPDDGDAVCVQCRRMWQAAYRSRHPERVAEQRIRDQNLFYERHPERRPAKRRPSMAITNPEEWRISRRLKSERNTKRSVRVLTGTYIRGAIIQRTRLKKRDVPECLVELKRNLIVLKRVIQYQKVMKHI